MRATYSLIFLTFTKSIFFSPTNNHNLIMMDVQQTSWEKEECLNCCKKYGLQRKKLNYYLEGVDIAESVLDVAVNDEFGETQNLATQMKRVAKPRLLPLLQHTSNTAVNNTAVNNTAVSNTAVSNTAVSNTAVVWIKFNERWHSFTASIHNDKRHFIVSRVTQSDNQSQFLP